MKKFIVLVIYDVVDNKTRNRLVKCLERYGVRVQKSAFEALLNRKQYDAMMRRASKMINPIEDSLRVYVLDDIINIYTWGLENVRNKTVSYFKYKQLLSINTVTM